MSDDPKFTRRDALKVGVTASALLALDRLPAFALPPSFARSGQAALPLIERAIPSTGEKVPVIGMGTARNYENPTPDMIPTLRAVLE